MSLKEQFLTITMMFASGFGLGILFDTCRVLCAQLRVSRPVISIVDIIYWIVATILVFKVLYFSNQGQLRFYVFIGLAAGVWIYFKLFSSSTVKVVLFMIEVAKRLVRICGKIIDLVIIAPVIGLYRLLLIILGFLAAISVFLFKIVLQSLYPIWVLVRWTGKWIRKRLPIPTWFIKAVKWLKSLLKRLF